MKNSVKWGMVTFCGCVTCAVIARYVPEPFNVVSVACAFLFSMIGSLAVSEEQREN